MQSAEDPSDRLKAAQRIHNLSVQRWCEDRATVIIGRHPLLEEALDKVRRFAAAEGPILITGSTGVGKELFARALFLSSPRSAKPFLSLNSAQYANSQLTSSELFGHRKGAFTGAASNHPGVFAEAQGGMVFLDEIGELTLPTQAMLLRTLSEGEVVSVGATQARRVDVRIVAATNRNLGEMVTEGSFRKDLYYRLHTLVIEVPSLQERGNDWQLIASYYLRQLNKKYQKNRTLSPDSVRALSRYQWPGNVRELKSLLETGYHLSDSDEITIDGLGLALEKKSRLAELGRVPTFAAGLLCEQMASGQTNFWEAIHQPFLAREVNRYQVREVIAYALARQAQGSYKKMLMLFGVPEDQYLKAMDFLRHHDLKP